VVIAEVNAEDNTEKTTDDSDINRIDGRPMKLAHRAKAGRMEGKNLGWVYLYFTETTYR
jgi:hypothetical protein